MKFSKIELFWNLFLFERWGSANSLKGSERIGVIGGWKSQSAEERCKSGFCVSVFVRFGLLNLRICVISIEWFC